MILKKELSKSDLPFRFYKFEVRNTLFTYLFLPENGRVYLVKSKVEENPFERLLGVGTVKMTTDEIMALTRGEK